MALVLSRKFEESVVISDSEGNEISIKVIEDKDSRNQVRFVIDAPKEFRVLRAEVKEREVFDF
ncbi:hypothetical protein BXO87_02160 [Bacillus sp. GZB]|uniref:carbon storage regulator n=1 Tax=Bacillus TaxID=1386 RepID=UPI00097841B8|nr:MULTISPECIES: carbon storage regulator [Bacillus]MCZ4246930.1 carbon storage regulator [Bacillus amyloliquefaciens]OMQ06830.1 hypothetical protein BXO87_02160 [Bacillus sp. GZB]